MKSPEALLADLARRADACELSWSLTAEACEERVLFFFETSLEAATALAEAATALGIDRALLADWSGALPAADAIGLALRTDRKSIRLYTQYWTALVAQVEAGDMRPTALYRGFKTLPDGVVRRDAYLCLPMADRTVFWPPMQAAFAQAGLDDALAARVFADLDAQTAIFTRIEGGDRQSWLTTVRRARIDRAQVAAWLGPLGDRPDTARLIATAGTCDMVHVAGGQDAVKGRFVTFYFGADAQDALALLGLQHG